MKEIILISVIVNGSFSGKFLLRYFPLVSNGINLLDIFRGHLNEYYELCTQSNCCDIMFNTYGKVAITDSIDLTALTVSNKQFCKHNIFISLSFCLHLMHRYKNVYLTWKFSFHYFSIQIFNFEVRSFKCDSTKWGDSLQVVWGAYCNI